MSFQMHQSLLRLGNVEPSSFAYLVSHSGRRRKANETYQGEYTPSEARLLGSSTQTVRRNDCIR